MERDRTSETEETLIERVEGAPALPGVAATVRRLVGGVRVVGLSRAEAEAELSSPRLEAHIVEVPSAEAEGTVVAQNGSPATHARDLPADSTSPALRCTPWVRTTGA